MEQLEQLEQLNHRSRPRAYADEEWKRGVPAVPGPTPTLPTEGGGGPTPALPTKGGGREGAGIEQTIEH